MLPNRIRMIVCLGLMFAGLSPTTNAAGPSRPNVVIILADDMGYSDLGCYGGEIATPNLDGLAQKGLRFSQFYNTARCWPTRAAILTGYYAQQVRRDSVPGVRSGGQGIRPEWAPLLPRLLEPAGYRSYHSGKWHVDGKRLAQGFHRSYSLEDHDRHFAPRHHQEDDKPLPAVKPGSGYYSSTAIADHAVRCLKEHAKEHGEKPFFSYVAFTAPHFPLHAPAEDIARYRETYRKGWEEWRQQRFNRLRELKLFHASLPSIERDVGPPYAYPEAIRKLGPGEINRPRIWTDLNPEQREFQAAKMAVHAAMIDRMDREVGRIIDQLRGMNALDNTLILFLSDNGATAEIMVRGDGHDQNSSPGSGATYLSLGPGWSSVSNSPFRRHKTWVHEGGIATPLIAHWPRGITGPGEIRTTPGHVIDLVPTILEAAKVVATREGKDQTVPKRPGKSLLPAFVREGDVPREELWWLHEDNRALRMGDWKLVAAAKKPWELYDLKADRAETRDLAKEQPERVREMAAHWERLWKQYADLARKD